MSKTKTIKSVEIRSLPELRRILTKFLLLNVRIAKSWEWKDFPWWYNERASLSVLAAAVWKTKGIAFEEFSSPKKKRKVKYSGRNDLYILTGKKEFTVEAKNLFVAAFSRNGSRARIVQKLKQAVKDVKRSKPYGTKRLAILFVVPKFDWSKRDVVSILIERWIDEIRKIPYAAAAWIFPKECRTKAKWKKTRLFPGVVVLVRKV